MRCRNTDILLVPQLPHTSGISMFNCS